MDIRISALESDCYSRENASLFIEEYKDFVVEFKTFLSAGTDENLDTKQQHPSSVAPTRISTKLEQTLHRTGSKKFPSKEPSPSTKPLQSILTKSTSSKHVDEFKLAGYDIEALTA